MCVANDPATAVSGADLFRRAEVRWHETPTATIAYRVVGAGPPLVMLHGWPLWGFTFRGLLPHLAAHFTCVLVDLPGGGDTVWTRDTDFTWPGQAASVKSLLEAVGFDEYDLLGQDSGGMIARHLCLLDGRRVRRLILTNTEVPGHRPPYLPMLRRLMFLPGGAAALRLALSSGWFLRSRVGFGGSLDPARIDGEFRDGIVRPLVWSRRRAAGHVRFLRGWSWAVLDRWAEFHRRLTMPVLLVWGAADETFPLPLADRMAEQFPDAAVRAVDGARLFVHEERPEVVADLILRFHRPDRVSPTTRPAAAR
jgi:haloalkane dehalogenase